MLHMGRTQIMLIYNYNYDADAFTNSTAVNQDLRLTTTSMGCSGGVNTIIAEKALKNGEM